MYEQVKIEATLRTPIIIQGYMTFDALLGALLFERLQDVAKINASTDLSALGISANVAGTGPARVSLLYAETRFFPAQLIKVLRQLIPSGLSLVRSLTGLTTQLTT